MRERLLKHLVCTYCKEKLDSESFEAKDGELWEGVLRCPEGHCFPVFGGIPRMVPGALDANRDWALKHGVPVQTQTVVNGQDPATVASFGFEWNTFVDYEYPIAKLRRDVLEQSGVDEDFFRGKLLLEAGCGAGRQLAYMASLGPDLVIGVDLSNAVERAKTSMKNFPNAEVVQADIYAMPFRERTFDFLYTEGMLPAVKDPRAAFRTLAKCVRGGGTISASFYLRNKYIPYELLLREPLRWFAKLLPLKMVYWGTWLSIPLSKIPLLNSVLRRTILVSDPYVPDDRRLWEINFDFYGKQKYQYYLLREQVETLLREPDNHLVNIRPTILGAYRATVSFGTRES